MDLRNLKKDQKVKFLKEVYEYCESCGWDVEKTSEYGEKIDASGDEVRSYGKAYLKNYMGLTTQEINKKILEINKSIRDSLSNRTFLSLTKDNELLKEKGITTKKLWNNEEEKRIVLEYIYKYSESIKYHTVTADELGRKLGIGGYEKVFKLAEMYAIDYLSIDKDEYDKYKAAMTFERIKNKDNPINDLYQQLLIEPDVEKQMKMIRKLGVNISELNSRAFDWSVTHGKPEDTKLLREILGVYAERTREEHALEKEKVKEEAKIAKLGAANEIIANFINSNVSISAFCERENLDRKEFEKYVNIVEEKNSDLYEQYKSRTEAFKASKYAVLVSKMKIITSQIINGIPTENNNIRPFDVIDYLSSTKLTYDQLFNSTKKALSQEEITAFTKFSRKNRILRNWNQKDIDRCYESKQILGFEMDSQGKIINPGSELTKEEKENIINYINKSGLPLGDNTYYCALKRYSKGYLSFDKEQNISFKKNS